MLCKPTKYREPNQERDSATKKNVKIPSWGPFVIMRLHSDMRIQVVQLAVSLLTTLPRAFVYALDLFVATARTLSPRNMNK